MCLKAVTVAELLLTNATSQPSTFIVWLQQMRLELDTPCKTFWTVSTRVRLCTSVNTNMILQHHVCLKQLPTVRTEIRSSVAMINTPMSLQVVGAAETFVTNWTLVWLICHVDCSDLQTDKTPRHLYTCFSQLWILLCLISSFDVVTWMVCCKRPNGLSPEWTCLSLSCHITYLVIPYNESAKLQLNTCVFSVSTDILSAKKAKIVTTFSRLKIYWKCVSGPGSAPDATPLGQLKALPQTT